MDGTGIGRGILDLVPFIVAVAGLGALSAGLMVGLSERLVGFRVPFKGVFKAVAAAIFVGLFLRAVGRALDNAVGISVGWALAFVGVIYFLAWYLDRHVPRPDGTPLGRGDAYRLAGVHAMVMVVVAAVGYAVIAART